MYNLKIIRSGNRLEIYKINDYAVKQKGDIPDKEQLEQVSGDKKELNEYLKGKKRRETLNTARNNIIRLIKANSDMNTFMTLTFASEEDYKQSKKSLKSFFNRVKKDYPNLKYLWVLEYGDKNNRLHYHMLCNIPINIKLSSNKEKKSKDHKALENEFSKKYWKKGFVDIRGLDQEGNTNIALYISVYITKSLENKDLEGYRVYGYSNKSLDKPKEEFYYTTDSLESILMGFSDEYSIKFSNSYGIGYTDYKGAHIGNVSYFDLELKGEIK